MVGKQTQDHRTDDSLIDQSKPKIHLPFHDHCSGGETVCLLKVNTMYQKFHKSGTR